MIPHRILNQCQPCLNPGFVDVDRVIFACPANAVGNILKDHTSLEEVRARHVCCFYFFMCLLYLVENLFVIVSKIIAL